MADDGRRAAVRDGGARGAGDQADHALIAHVEYSRHSGPLPAPADLAAYEAVLAGAAERIMRMAEKNSDALIAERHRESVSFSVGTVVSACLPAILVGAAVPLPLGGFEAAGTVAAVAGAFGVAPQIVISVKNAFNRRPEPAPAGGDGSGSA